MADVKKQCESCEFWLTVMGSYSSNNMRVCHHLLYTGRRREEENDICKSHTPRRRKGVPHD